MIQLGQLFYYAPEKDGGVQGLATVQLELVLQDVAVVDDVLELVQEPLVDARDLVQLVDGELARLDGAGEHEDALVRGVAQLVLVVLAVEQLAVGVEAHDAVVDHSERFLECFLEAATDRHHFAHTLHGAA